LLCTVAEGPIWDLTTEEAKEKIDHLAKMGYEILCLTGGEPSIRNDLPDLIIHAKGAGIRKIELQTNCLRLVDKRYAKKLASAGLDSALVPLHSHIKRVSEELTQTAGSFNKAVAGIKNLQSCSIHISLSHVINSKNYKNLMDFVKFVWKTFSKQVHIYFSFVRPNGRAWKNKWIVPKLVDIEPYIYKTFSNCEERGISFSVEGLPLCYMVGFENYSEEMARNFASPSIYLEKNTKLKICIITLKPILSLSPDAALFATWPTYARVYGKNIRKFMEPTSCSRSLSLLGEN
jgi:MoaA/NifB/PqqE/SkfB family radical SAM enzyme